MDYFTEHQKTILCVDDTPANLKLLKECLQGQYKVRLINHGQKAIEFLADPGKAAEVHMVLLDVMMPDVDGFEVCRKIRSQAHTQHLPVIFITAKNTPLDEQMGLDVGGNDFISKPINPNILLSRVNTHLKLESYQTLLRKENAHLEIQLKESLLDVVHLQEATLMVMTSLAEFRDEDTGNHIKRTQIYIEKLAHAAAKRFPELTLTEERISIISMCSPLHDIGKITTPDHILLKPGKLSDEEFEQMKLHTVKGFEILGRAAKLMAGKGEFLTLAQELAISHHEKWNGSGYPYGKSGNDIPISGRLMAVVDVYDALRSQRVYKPAFSHEKSMAIIEQSSGSHFDPRLVEAFMSLSLEIEQLSEQWKD